MFSVRTNISWHTKLNLLIARDCLVIPCANQLGKHTDLGNLAQNLSKVECPIIAIARCSSKSFDEDIEVSEGSRFYTS